MRLPFIIAALGVAAPAPPAALRAETAESWTMFLVSGPVRGRLLIWSEAQPRFILTENARIGQMMLRQAIGVRTAGNIDLMLGYHTQSNTSDRTNTTREHRIYQHIAGHVFENERIDVQGQFRLEQRMFVGEPTTIWRARAQLRVHLPLHGEGTFGPVFASETMFNLNGASERRRSGFEQQRTSAGLHIPLGGSLSLEPGYLNQRLARRGPDRNVHVANIKLAWKLGRAPPLPDPMSELPASSRSYSPG